MIKKVIWITGASSGIGESLAYVYARLGCRLILTSRNRDALVRVAQQCHIEPSDIYILPGDLAHPDTADQIVPQALSHFGTIHTVVHSAGVSQRSLGIETSLEVDRQMMQLNYFSAIQITKGLLSHFKEQNGGSVIVLSSISGLIGYPKRSAYAASKFALHGFFETLQTEKQPVNVHYLIVCPGRVKTAISLRALKGDGSPHGSMDSGQEHGISPDIVAKKIVDAEKRKKKRLIIAREEWILLILHRICRPLYYWLANKTGMK